MDKQFIALIVAMLLLVATAAAEDAAVFDEGALLEVEAVDEAVWEADCALGNPDMADDPGMFEAQLGEVWENPGVLPAAEADADGIPIDEAHFPDAAFRKYLMEDPLYYKMIDANADGWLDAGEMAAAVKIDLTKSNGTEGLGVTTLKGIEYFPNLEILYCAHNPITSIDVSMLKKLAQFTCGDCAVTSLNVSGCRSLQWLNCVKNQITSLDVSTCESLSSLAIYDNPLASVDITNCPALSDFPKGFNIDKFNKLGIISCMKSANGRVTAALTFSRHTNVVNGSWSSDIGMPGDAIVLLDEPGATPVESTIDPASTAKLTRATVTAAPGARARIGLGDVKGKKFKSSNKKIAVVDRDGVVTFKKAGRVTITYRGDGQARKVVLSVTDPTIPTSIALDPSGTVDAKVGNTVSLTATMNAGAVSAIKWKSSKKKVATVNADGVVTFKKAGKVTITCTAKRGKKKASVTFEVSD